MVVVEAVGARFIAHASSGTLTSSVTCDAVPSVDPGLPVRLITAIPSLAKIGSSRRSSSVSPEYESAKIKSPRLSIPRSPCSASTGCRKHALVPVEFIVAATLRAIIPDLPSPVSAMRCPAAAVCASSASASSSAGRISPSSRSASCDSALASTRTKCDGLGGGTEDIFV